MTIQAIMAWAQRNKSVLVRVVLAMMAIFAIISASAAAATSCPILAMLDYSAAVAAKVFPQGSPLAFYAAIFGLLALPTLGRFFHELDVRKKDRSLRPLIMSIFVALASFVGVSILIRIAYHMAYRTTSPAPSILEIVLGPLALTMIYAIFRVALWSHCPVRARVSQTRLLFEIGRALARHRPLPVLVS